MRTRFRTPCWMAGCLAVVSLLAAPMAQAQATLTPLLESGPTHARINVVVLSEGYTAAQLPAFLPAAQRIVEDLLATAPYPRYRTYFNAFALSVASPESGSDHPSRGIFRDTYFDTFYDCNNIQRLICLGPLGQNRAMRLLQSLMPEYDIVLVLVNDAEYGGSGGSLSVASAHPSASEIAIHEIGHSFAGLADEYGGVNTLGFESKNTTSHTAAAAIPWARWIEPTTPLPTPTTGAFDKAVGLFEGAAYCDKGCFRPQLQCKMRSLGVSFCRICHEYHVAAIYNLVRPVSSASPEARQLSAAPTDTLRFEVEPMRAAQQPLAVTWFVDGAPVATDVHRFSIPAALLAASTSAVSVRVRDETADVRDEAVRSLLEETISWQVERTTPSGREEATAAAFSLAHHPNPARESTSFFFTLPRPETVTLEVFDVVGRRVATVTEGAFAAGPHEVHWALPALPSGIYLYRLDTPTYHTARRLTVVQ